MAIQRTSPASPLEFKKDQTRAEVMTQYRDTGSSAAPLLATLPFLPGRPFMAVAMAPGTVRIAHGLPQAAAGYIQLQLRDYTAGIGTAPTFYRSTQSAAVEANVITFVSQGTFIVDLLLF